MINNKPTVSIWLLLIVASCHNLFAQAGDKKDAKLSGSTAERLDRYMMRLEGFGFSGQTLVMEKGRLLLNKGFGLAKRGPQTVPVTENTVFDIASLTKQFTAAAILHLETEGKLRTNASIAEYLGGTNDIPADKAAITIDQLITHTSGLRRDAVSNSSSEIISRDELVRRILESPLAAAPGERFSYSNAGYNLLAAIIERVSGQSFTDYLTQSLFKPAGMRSTFSQTDYVRKTKTAAHPYNEWKELTEFYNRPVSWQFFGPAGISSTAGDLYKWIRALQENKVLSKTARDKFLARHTPLEEGVFYGYGWYIETTKSGSDLISHGGDTTGMYSELRWEPENDRLIIVLTNQDVFGLSGGAVQKRIVADNLTRILEDKDYQEPSALKQVPVKKLKKYEGTYSLAGDSGGFKIWLEGDRLKIGAEGQQAINLLTSADQPDLHIEENKLAKLIFETIARGETATLKQSLSEEEYNTYISFLEKEFSAQIANAGKLRQIVVRGSIYFPYNKNFSRTYLRLEFEKGVTNLFLGLNKGKINDVTMGDEKPFPLILPLAPQSKTKLSAFDLFSSQVSAIKFTLNGRTGSATAITLQTKTGNVTLQKLKSEK